MTPGLSGCRIRFSGGRVLKYGDPKKLHAQAKKLMLMKQENICKWVSYPDDIRLTRGGYSMELVRGQDALDYLHECTVPSARWLVRCLFWFVQEEFSRSTIRGVPGSIISSKIFDTLNRAAENKHVQPHKFLMMAKHFVAMAKGYLPRIVQMPIGPCHGDLTLGNILLCGSNIVLIDPIDVFLESPLMDVAKLAQEIVHGWSTRLAGGAVDRKRIEIILDELGKEVLEIKFDQQLAVDLCALNMLRILPYCGGSKEITEYVVEEVLSYA